jgi:hypothetical protein
VNRIAGAIVLLMGVSLFSAGQESTSPTLVGSTTEYPTATIREEQNITVDGVSETWRLQWQGLPKLYCEPSDESLTCPCDGFAYGEVGDLFLVRLRNGTEIDRLHLTPLFGEEPGAVLRRWPANYDQDFRAAENEDFPDVVRKRPVVQIMHFDDYDHDGKKTEFYLQTEAICGGHHSGVVIGISGSDPRLHIFATVSSPGKPLYLEPQEWNALRDAYSPSVKVLDWACGDHGSPTETDLQLNWSVAGIDGVRREYTCPSKSETRTLVSEKPL